MSKLTIAVYGDYVVDRVHRFAHRFRWHTANIVRTQLRPGGAATYMATCLARLGVTARALGRLGADADGRWLLTVLADHGIDTSYLDLGDRTGVVTVLVEPGGERTFLLDAVHNARHHAATDALYGAATDGVDAVHISGHALIRDLYPDHAARRVAALRAGGICTTMELPDAPTLAAFGIDDFRQMIDCAGFDLVFTSRAEADTLGIGKSWIPGRGSCVVTAGAEPVTIISRDATVTVPVEPFDGVVDTTGAGDVFAATFLASWLAGAPHRAAVAAAHQAARRLISAKLGRFPTGDRAEDLKRGNGIIRTRST